MQMRIIHAGLAMLASIVIAIWPSTGTGQSGAQLPMLQLDQRGYSAGADGVAEIAWSPSPTEGSYDFAIVELRTPGVTLPAPDGQLVEWLPRPAIGARHRFMWLTPGPRQVRVKACRRVDGTLHCGPVSASATVTVPANVSDPRPVSVPPPAESGDSGRSPAFLPSGQYGSNRSQASAWYFHWNNNLTTGIQSPGHGDRNILFAYWTTYRDFAPAFAPPEQRNLQPVWLIGQLVDSPWPNWFTGALQYFRAFDLQPLDIGTLSSFISSPTTAPSIWWQVSDPSFYHDRNPTWVSDTLHWAFAGAGIPPGTPNAVDHYAGGWFPQPAIPAADAFTKISTMGGALETSMVLFYDASGEPIWATGINNGYPSLQPTPSTTSFCLYTVTGAWYPNQHPPQGHSPTLHWMGHGCGSQAPGAWNVERAFNPLSSQPNQWGQLRVRIDLPASVRGTPKTLNYGWPSTAGQMVRLTNNHDVRILIGQTENPSSCQASAGGACNLELNYFSGGFYPEAKVYRRRQSGSQWVDPVLVAGWTAANRFSVVRHPHAIAQNGTFRFELRRNGADDQLIAMSPAITVAGAGNSMPDTPPAPAPDPLFAVDPESARTGATRGEFRVDERGGATYRIPIMTAPATGGFAPSVALVYGSQSGTGVAGQGWHLEGRSAISRCASTIESRDQTSRPVLLDRFDQFCLDGQRLVLVEGSHGAPGARYRLEVDQFVVATIGHGTHGSGDRVAPTHFIVERKDGSRSIYGHQPGVGTDPSARILASTVGTIYEWPLARVEDAAQNFQLHVYGTGPSGDLEYQLQEIRYAGNAVTGQSPHARLTFTYENLPAREQRRGFVATQPVRTSLRLATIRSLGEGDALLRRYALAYGTDGVDASLGAVGQGRSVLESVRECFGEGTDECLAPTVFTWERGATQIPANPPQLSPPLVVDDFLTETTADLDGDGRQDLVFAAGPQNGAASLHWVRSRPDGGTDRGSVPMACGTNGRHVAGIWAFDLDGSARQGIVYVAAHCPQPGDRGIYFHGWSGMALEPARRIASVSAMGTLPDTARATISVIDENGDGLADLIVHGQGLFGRQQLPDGRTPDWNPAGAFTPLWVYRNRTLTAPPGIDPLESAIAIEGGFDWLIGTPAPMDCSSAPGGPYPFGEYRFIVAPYGVGAFDVDGSARPAIAAVSSVWLRCERIPRSPDASGLFGSDDVIDRGGVTVKVDERAQVLRLAPREGFGGGVIRQRLEAWAPISSASVTDTLIPTDVNGDGLTDLLNIPAGCTHNCFIHLEINEGATGPTTGRFAASTLALPFPIAREVARHVRVLDWNGDGDPDLWVPQSHNNGNAQAWIYPWRWTGAGGGGFSSTPVVGPSVGRLEWGDTSIFLDQNGDGRMDQYLFRRDSDRNRWRLHGINGQLAGCGGFCGHVPHVISRITDGFGAWTRITYKTLAQSSVYSRDRLGPYVGYGQGSPVYDLIAPIPVVSEAASLAPQAVPDASLQSHQWLPEGESRTSYYYVGAKVQSGGRGFLGFREVLSHDPQTGMLTRTRYDQRFPFIGTPIETEVSWQASAPWPTWDGEAPLTPWPSCAAGSIRSGVRLSCSLNELSMRATVGSLVHPFVASSEVRTWQPSMASGVPSASVFSHRVVTTHENVDVHGNVGRVIVETARSEQGPIAAADRLSRQVSDQIYGPGANELRFGRLTCSTVSHERPGLPMITRRSSFGYDSRGLLNRETVEPSSCAASPTSFETNTVYSLDAYGNRTQTLVSARGEAEPRGTQSQYDARGRFVDVERVRLGGGVWRMVSQVQSRDRYGNPTRVLAGNGVESLSYFDSLGRPHYQYSPDGAWSRVLWRPGAGTHCPAGTAMHEIKTAGGGAETVTCKDRLGRAVRTVTWTKDGAAFRVSYADVHYDFASRPVAATEPYRPGTTDGMFWTRTAYDELGRVEFVRAPDGGLTGVSYLPRSQGGVEEVRTVTDTAHGISRTTRTEVDALGESVREVAADTGVTTHGRDALGRVVWADGPLPGAVDRIEITYTVTGHRTEVIDPDKGTWRYAVNGFGEVTCQLDAKGQAHWHRYDGLGRLLRREVRTGVVDVTGCAGTQVGWTEWVYGNSNGSGTFGQVLEVAHSQTEAAPVGQVLELQTFSYDALGRVTLRRTDLREPGTGGNFVVYEERTTYDEFGRVFQMFDASGGNRGLRHHYDSRGHLVGLREARQGASGRLYWELLGTDARGQVSQARLGNGMVVTAERWAETGQLRRLRDQLGGTVAQDLELWWDRVGQLQARRDSAAGVRSERFSYDARGRLTTTWDLGGAGFAPGTTAGTQVQSQSYDLSGNITWKSDVGSYQYGLKPHAVISAGGVSYSYDANGNVTGDGTGRSFTVSARDQVVRIQRGGEESRFLYGSSGGRVVHTQLVNGVATERTHYIGPVEVVHRNGSREFRRSLGGSALATFFEATQVEQVRYLHKDHLGSTVAISDESGQVIQRMSFDPWGQRRTASPWWPQQAIPAGQLAAIRAITPRGYTGHEHLDALGIIHMNGRIYDPRLARFLQADPLIEDGSTLNRYTYVHNDPLAWTDPSGYWGRREQNALRTIVAVAIAVWTGGQVNALLLEGAKAQAFALAAAGGAVAGGIQSGTVEGAAWGAFSAGVFFGIGQAIQGADSLWNVVDDVRTGLNATGMAVKTISHGLAGGTISHLQGGKFGHGFVSAAGSAATAPLVDAASANVIRGAIVTTLVGGTLSRISGGNFANGALTAAMSYAFNQVASSAYREQATVWHPISGLDDLERSLTAFARGEVLWPTDSGHVSSYFGMRQLPGELKPRLHNGIDVRAREGWLVYSTQTGIVSAYTSHPAGGNQIFVRNADGSLSGYAHTRLIDGLSVGDVVRSGDAIGVSDGSGAGAPHVHYTYRPGSFFRPATFSTTPVDPLSTQLRGVARPPFRDGTRPW